MLLLKRTGEGFLLGAVIFLLFIVAFEARITLPRWLFVVGRMHPMFLHFPIVLLLIYLFSLWLPSRVNDELVNVLGLLAAITATLTAIMGFILSMEELREGTTFSLHKWGGISMALVAVLFYYLHKSFARTKLVARPLSLAAAALVLLTGHWGGNLTHGENYILEPFASASATVAFDQAFAFEDVVRPVLLTKCGTCHSGSGKKGGLSIEDSAGVTDGGKGGPLYIAGSPDSSLLMQRILLPAEDKKHMAPKSKPQLSEQEIQLLRAWIKAGAPLRRKVIDLPGTDSFRLAAAGYLTPSASGQTAYDFPAAPDEKIKLLNNNNRVVVPLGKHSPALTVQFYGSTGYSAKALEELLQVKEQIIELNLAKMAVKDEDVKFILQLQNLQKLNLNNTDLTDKGIIQLAGLQNLKELAVSGTAVTAASLQKLVQLPLLASVFVWNTKLDSAGVASLQKMNKRLSFYTGYTGAKDTVKYTLNPPAIKTPEGIYDEVMSIEVKHGIRGVEIRYTLDGSVPDSTTSAIYKNPLTLDTSATLKVKAYKDGWYSSVVAERVFIRKGISIDTIELLAAADSSFNPNNTKILHDQSIGSPSGSKNKKWYGFKKNDGVCLLVFNQPTEVRQLQVLSLSAMGNDVFPAESMDVWTGTDKKKLTMLAKVRSAMPMGYQPSVIAPVKFVLRHTVVKYIKVVIHPLKKIPAWHHNKGKAAVALVGEIVVN